MSSPSAQDSISVRTAAVALAFFLAVALADVVAQDAPQSGGNAQPPAAADAPIPEAVTLPFELSFSDEIDGTRGLPVEQQPTVYEVLAAAASQDPAAQKAWALHRNRERNQRLARSDDTIALDITSWDDLLRSPNEYRGQLVTLKGRFRSIEQRAADKNDSGIDTVYDVRLISQDTEQPVFILSTSIPEAMPTGDGLTERGSVTGYFFKLQSFLGPDGESRMAPLVLSRQIEWDQNEPVNPARLGRNILASVKPLSRGIPAVERDSYYRALTQARDVPQSQQKTAAAAFYAARKAKHDADPQRKKYLFSLFADLFNHAAEVQGEAVTIHGHMRKLLSYPAGKNDYKLTTLHEAWIYPEDASNNPVVVVCTQLPEGLPVPSERDSVSGITVTGYFFKRYVYDAEDKARVAPMILAHELEWTPPTAGGIPAVAKYGLAVAGLGIIFVMLVAQLRSNRKDREFRKRVGKTLEDRGETNPAPGIFPADGFDRPRDQ